MTYVLAQYTIRSKQEYIFRSNRVTEIIGASDNITRSWDILFEQAEKLFEQSGVPGKKTLRLADQKEFHISEIAEAFRTNTLHMVELFRGGGNETILFDSHDSYIKVNKAFSYYLLKKYPGLIPMAVCSEYTGDYQHDYTCLMQEADREKKRMITGQSDFILPFSMMDRNTFQPYSCVEKYEDGLVRLTAEAQVKRKRGQEISREDPEVQILDNMIIGKGEESLLAVIHADGNNMGIKISKMLEGKTDYDTCISKMREFTEITADAFSVQGVQALEKCRDTLQEKYKGKYEFIGNFTLNSFNTTSINIFRSLGLSKITLSPELNLEDITNIHNTEKGHIPLELIVYGNVPVMKMNYCVLGVSNKCYPDCMMRCRTNNKYYLIDRLGFKFRILPDNVQTVTTIFNSKTTCITHIETGINSLRIDLLEESIDEINEIAKASSTGAKLEGKQYTYGNLNREV